MSAGGPQDAPFRLSRLPWRARLTYAAHLWKAVSKQHHKDLIPFLFPFVPENGVVFDVGAHAGQFAKLFARLAKGGQVWSFEPSSYARSILVRAVAFNRLRNVKVRPDALGEKEGALFLSTPLKRGGSFRFGLSHLGEEGRQSRRERVRLTTIDRLVAEEGLGRLDFIKADIEGWELKMLRGGDGALKRFEPALLLEVNENALARAGDTPAALWEFLSCRGYRPWRLGEPAPLPPDCGPVTGDILWLPPHSG